ncbi:MAG: hypothetical protein FWG06_00005 [Clostridiales bacterium]|nr:hypothetical protein [Clostridiales bacterium]
MHFYILEKHLTPGKYGYFLSYQVGLIHDNAPAVGGELEVTLDGIEAEAPGRVAVVRYSIKNTGDATDIVRVAAEGDLDTVMLNNIYAIGAGETITVYYYVELPEDICDMDLEGLKIEFTASSESNDEKVATAAVALEDLTAPYNFKVWLEPAQTLLDMGDILCVDIMLKGDLNYTMAETKVAFDTDLFEYIGYDNLSGWMTQVQKEAPNLIATRNVAAINMNAGAPCAETVRLITLKFKVKDTITEERIESALSFDTINIYSTPAYPTPSIAPGKDMPVILFGPAYVKGFYHNIELYPNWIGLDDQGLPSTMPLFNYDQTDASTYINEIVWVEVPCDTDRSGKRDRVSLWIRRPITKEGFKCPVVMEFSPYHAGTRGYQRMSAYINSEDDHLRSLAETFKYHDNYPVTLGINPDTTYLTYDDIKYKGTEAWDPIWWESNKAFKVNSWYTGVPYGSVPDATVPTGVGKAASTGSWRNGTSAVNPAARWHHYFTRGYAMVYGQLLGNRDSDGITNTMHVEEWLSAAAAVKWFNGEAKAFTTRTSTVEVIADWALGHVALDGTSYPGTTPTLAAMAGAKGLKAIMPEAHVTSWYEYYRSGGALHGPEGYGGEDMNLHSSYNFSRFNADSSSGIPSPTGTYFGMAAQLAYVETQKYMMEKQDRKTGDYNDEWDARNLTRGYGKIPDDVGILQTNGQQDWNVMPRHAYECLQALRDNFGGYDADSYGTHKIVSTLTKHASQTGRVVQGKDGVERGMLKWYLMFLDHYLLGLDNHVDELMYDVNIVNHITGVMEGYDYDIATEERGTIIPGTKYQDIFLAPAEEGHAGRLSYNEPAAAVEHFDDLTIDQQVAAPQHPGAPARPTSWINIPASQGNQTPTTAAINYCDDRVLGVNRTTTNYGTYGSLFGAVDRPVEGRLMYLSEPLSEDTLLSGTPVAHLNMSPTKGTGNLTVALVEIGRKQRVAVRIEAVSTATTGSITVFPTTNGATSTTATRYANPPHASNASTSNFKYVTWGHTDAQNPSYDGKAWFQVPEQNYIPNYYFQTTELDTDEYYDYVVELNPYNYLFKAGMQIGVMVYGTDTLASPCLDAASTGGFDIQLGEGSYISLPLKIAEPTEEVTIEVGSKSVVAGEVFDIPYSIKDNVFGFSTLSVELPFDAKAYAPFEVTPSALLGDAELTFVIEGGALKVAIAAEENIVGDGELFTVTYKVAANAPYIFSLPLDVKEIAIDYSSIIDKKVAVTGLAEAGVVSTKVVQLVPTASVKKQNGNKNDLTITVTAFYDDGTKAVFSKVFSISNNADGHYEVGGYIVFVDTKGNDQIRSCFIDQYKKSVSENDQGQNGNSQGGNSQGGNSQGGNSQGNSQGNSKGNQNQQ